MEEINKSVISCARCFHTTCEPCSEKWHATMGKNVSCPMCRY
jgi:hypothetical protein